MAKRSTPKKQQAGSSTSARYNTFKKKAQRRLEKMARGFSHSLNKGLKIKSKQKAEKASSKVTKVKA